MESSISSKLATFTSKAIATPQFLTLSYWFGTPEATGLLGLLLLTILVVWISLSAVLMFGISLRRKGLTPPQKRYLSRFGWYALSLSIVGWLLLVVRMFGVLWLSARFFWILWIASLGFVLWTQGRFYINKLPAQQGQYQSYLLKKRYLPAKKKKK